MMKGITRSGFAAILRKELYRFFTDRRAVFTTVLMPGLMIFLMYTFIGEALTNMYTVDEDYQASIMVVNTPSSIKGLADTAGLTLTSVDSNEINALKDSITNKQVDLLIIFPADFDEQLANKLTGATSTEESTIGQEPPPTVELYYNSTSTQSSTSYGTVSTLLTAYRDAQFTLFVINPGTQSGAVYDLATEQDQFGFILSALLPMLIIAFMFSGCMSVAPESIAGEKERGTIATLLVTPLKRHELAIGKVVALSIIALLAAISSFIGIILSIPRITAAATSDVALMSLYNISDYLLLLMVMLSTVLLFIGLLSVISAFSKTIKEATTWTTPLFIVVVLIAIAGAFSGGSNNLVLYLIPSFNSAQCIAGIFAFTIQPMFVVVTVLVNLLIAGVCIFGLTRMFNSERVVFAR